MKALARDHFAEKGQDGMHLVTEITNSILALGVFGVFFGMMLESAYIPIPSEVILPYAGYLAYTGRTTLPEAMLAGLLGGLAGSVVGYWVARYGGRPLLERYGRYVFIQTRHLDQAEAWFKRRGDGAVFLGRLLPVIRTYISFPAGVAEMRFGRFVLFSLLGAVPWTIFLTYVGFQLGHNWRQVTTANHLLLAGALVILIVWLARMRRRVPKNPR